MPAPAPATGPVVAARLASIGARLRSHRKAQGVSATAAAEAAGISRVTLHRIERGEPSVSVASYMAAAAAIGLTFDVVDPKKEARLPRSIRLADYPELQRLAWQLRGVTSLAPKEALALYERNWRHLDKDALEPRERELVRLLAERLGGGRLLV